jgi:hypothetical protein
VFDDTLLDDEHRLTAADPMGLLRAAATAGAQLRATEEAARDVGIGSLAGSRPRALVLLSRPGLSPGVSAILTALLGASCPIPVVTARSAPTWVGALDVVLAHTDDPGDLELAESVAMAGRRGAQVVVTAPADGPVAAAGAGAAMLVTARVPVPSGFGYFRALATGLCLIDALGMRHVDLGALAGALDAEAERDHLSIESFVNPAKALALRLGDRTPLLWGVDPLATAVGVHAAQVLAAYAGVVCDVAGSDEAVSRPALRAGAMRSNSAADIFADPDDTEQGRDARLRLLLLGVADDREAQQRLAIAESTFEGADVVAPREEVEGDELARAAVLALRFELAALYLGLAGGTIGGAGTLAPAPL